jgi:3-methyladenine DNA glycosylase/8-oxoguanine DNA glycosylase
VRSIVFQQLAGPAARAILGRVTDTVGSELTPQAFSNVTDDQLRAAGLSWNKIASLRDLSEKVTSGEVDIAHFARKRDDEVSDSLTQVRGIGKWSAEMFLMFELRRLDIWPIEDLGVRQGYGLIWGMDPSPKPKELLGFGEPFHPYRSIVALYCWEAVALAKGGDISLR